jgi:hypothetical protein
MPALYPLPAAGGRAHLAGFISLAEHKHIINVLCTYSSTSNGGEINASSILVIHITTKVEGRDREEVHHLPLPVQTKPRQRSQLPLLTALGPCFSFRLKHWRRSVVECWQDANTLVPSPWAGKSTRRTRRAEFRISRRPGQGRLARFMPGSRALRQDAGSTRDEVFRAGDDDQFAAKKRRLLKPDSAKLRLFI